MHMTKVLYHYRAVHVSSGAEQCGTIEAESRAQAAALLKGRGLAPMSIDRTRPILVEPHAGSGGRSPKGSSVPPRRTRGWNWGHRIRRRQVMHFTRQLATLVNAGVPLARGLDVLQRQERHGPMRAMVAQLAAVIGGGGTLSDGLRQFPGVFDNLYVNMATAGEAGGLLGTVLERQASFLEKSERLKNRVQTAMMYPAIIMAVAAAIVATLMFFVVPKFEMIFSGMFKGQGLPELTRWLLAASRYLQRHFLLGLAIAGAAGCAMAYLRRTQRGMAWIDWLVLRVPVMGDLALKAAVARVARTLSSLLGSGVPILDALTIVRAASGNVHVGAALDHVRERIKQGESIAAPLEATGVFPQLVTGMIQVGEETGALPEMLTRVADTYDEEVDQAVAGLTSLLEPVMIVIMAVVVGVIVVALFLPIVSVIQHLQ